MSLCSTGTSAFSSDISHPYLLSHNTIAQFRALTTGTKQLRKLVKKSNATRDGTLRSCNTNAGCSFCGTYIGNFTHHQCVFPLGIAITGYNLFWWLKLFANDYFLKLRKLPFYQSLQPTVKAIALQILLRHL